MSVSVGLRVTASCVGTLVVSKAGGAVMGISDGDFVGLRVTGLWVSDCDGLKEGGAVIGILDGAVVGLGMTGFWGGIVMDSKKEAL